MSLQKTDLLGKVDQKEAECKIVKLNNCHSNFTKNILFIHQQFPLSFFEARMYVIVNIGTAVRKDIPLENPSVPDFFTKDFPYNMWTSQP